MRGETGGWVSGSYPRPLESLHPPATDPRSKDRRGTVLSFHSGDRVVGLETPTGPGRPSSRGSRNETLRDWDPEGWKCSWGAWSAPSGSGRDGTVTRKPSVPRGRIYDGSRPRFSLVSEDRLGVEGRSGYNGT